MKKPPYEELEKELLELKIIHTKSIKDQNELNSEKNLLLSEEILEDLFRLSPSLMVIENPEGKVFKINNSCETILGYTEKEIMEIGLGSMIHPDDVERTNRAIESRLKGNPILNFTNRYKNKNDSYRTLEWQATIVKDGFTYAYANDITEQNEALVELLFLNDEKEKRANELILANKELLFQNNQKKKRADELIIANTELSYQNGEKHKRADELILANKELHFQNEQRKKRAAELKIATIELELQKDEKGKRADELIIANIELEHEKDEKGKRADELKIANVERKTQIHIQEKLKNALIIVHEEMDLQSEVQEKLEDELIVANHELDLQSDGIKKRADELVVANIELEHQQDLKAKRADELISANKELKQQSKEIVKSAEELFVAYVDIEKQNEEILKRADELIIANRELEYQNKEKEKRAEELVLANIELEYQNREKGKRAEELKDLNATKDKLFSIIAHDLRSPFNGILGFSELLMDNLEEYDTEESEVYLGIINSSAKSTLVLLDNLLDWAKYQTGQINFNPEKIKFSSIIQEILDVSILAARIKNISLNYVQSKDIEVYADLNMLKTVLRNLISNSIKFTNSKGSIEINAIRKKEFVEITVSYDGVGMDKETLNTLFTIQTNQTKLGTAKESGSGLGLLLCKEFAEKHGGKIRAESKIGKGSSFKVTLPLSP